jgi:hypothetical protein
MLEYQKSSAAAHSPPDLLLEKDFTRSLWRWYEVLLAVGEPSYSHRAIATHEVFTSIAKRRREPLELKQCRPQSGGSGVGQVTISGTPA